MSLPNNIHGYLKKQNLNSWKIELIKDRLFNNIIVIPAINELKNIPKLLNSLSLNSKKYLAETLVLIVINNTTSTENTIIKENQKLLNYIKIYSKENSSINIGVIDAASKGKELPDKSAGVGFARKIGMDLGLKLFNYNTDKKKILISLDADCVVSENYLQTIVEDFNDKNLHAAVTTFEHILPKDENQKAAIINYEIFLRYYILGLIYVKSHYAFLSIGSTIICDAESYIKVGGMNKRKAGEDFYFLEKLAKINKIHKVVDATVYPSARISNRVPFGTGPRIKRFLEDSQNEYLVYSPKSFLILQDWLTVLNEISTSECLKNPTFQKSWVFLNSKQLLQDAKSIHNELFNFLISQNFEESWTNILQNSKSEKQLKQNIKNWMDGFRTLKLIHYLRDYQFPNENMFTALNKLFTKLNLEFNFATEEPVPTLEIQLEYLNFLRKLT